MIGCGIGLTPMGGTTAMTRAGFVQRMLAISTNSCTFLWASQSGDTNTSTTDDTNARTITWDADVSGRITAQGTNSIQTFASASSQFGTVPDTQSMSFGNGATDLPFSIVALINVTDTAANRQIISKYDAATGREYLFFINSADKLELILDDHSLPIDINRTSDAAITQGALHLVAATYDGTGGATAANGITLYQDRAVIASTANNGAGTYVAMENGTTAPEIGSASTHTVQFYDGSMGFVRVDTVALTLAQINEICDLANAYYGLSL